MAPVGDDARSERVARDSAALRLEIVARPQRARRRGRVVVVRLVRRRAPRVRVGDFGLWNEFEFYWTRRARLGPRAFGGQNASRREFGTPHRNRGFSGERGRRVPAARVPVGRGADSRRRRRRRFLTRLDRQARRDARVRRGRVRASGAIPHHAANASVVREAGERTHADEKTDRTRSISSRAPIGAQTLALGARGELLRVFPPRPRRGRGGGVRARRRAARRAGVRQGARLGGVHGRERLRGFSERRDARRVRALVVAGGRSPSARFDFAPNGARAPTSIDAPIESVKTNADGSCLLVSFGLEPSGSSHVCVYDVANDAWASFDFAAQIRRVVETVAWDCRFPSLFCAQTARLETSPPSSSFSSSSRSNATEGSVSADESLADASLVDARFREDRDRAGVVAFTCFAARRDERSFSKDDANAPASDEGTRAGNDAVCFVAPRESHVLPDGFDAVLGVAAPCLFVSRKADARAKSGDRSAPARGACFSLCMRDFEGVDAIAESNDHRVSNENDGVASSLLAFHEALASTSADPTDPNERALRAAKKLTHPAAWLCAGRASVRRKRLDVAELCLSHTGHVRGARAARAPRRTRSRMRACRRRDAPRAPRGRRAPVPRLRAVRPRGRALRRLRALARRGARLAEARDRVHLRSTHARTPGTWSALAPPRAPCARTRRADARTWRVPRLLRARGETHALEAYVTRRSARSGEDDEDATTRGSDDAKTYVDDSRLHLRARGAWRAKATRRARSRSTSRAARSWTRRARVLRRGRPRGRRRDGASRRGGRRERERPTANASETRSGRETPIASLAPPVRAANTSSPRPRSTCARAFEARDAIGEAIAYFSKAGRFGHAMRLATRHGMDGEAARLALKSVRCEKSAAETARFFLRRRRFYSSGVALRESRVDARGCRAVLRARPVRAARGDLRKSARASRLGKGEDRRRRE